MPQSPLSHELFDFLEDLQANNDRDWFAENKSRYEEVVREPVLELITQLAKPMARSAPMLKAVPKKVGGSLMRIYRDTRFSKDKTPYKTNVGISLRHDADGDIHAPGVYVHLATEDCFIGAGCWQPASPTLSAIRRSIDEDPKSWLKARDNKAFRAKYELTGSSLKTAPRDYPKDHPMIEDLRRKDFIGIAPVSRKDLIQGDACKLIMDHIKAGKSLMAFICDSVGIPY
ncbi:MAG: DUF2461 domain-containing protein [Planctomycetota bacterium]